MEISTFGDLLRSYRQRAGLTQEELAEQARLSVRALSDLERGARRKPRKDTLAFLAEALHLSTEEQKHLEARVQRARRSSRPAVEARSDGGTFHPLPIPLTRLIGREREESAATHLLQQGEVRLLTLTGPAGVGKTRLGLQVAASLQPEYRHGVCLVSLAAIHEPVLVLSAIAQALNLRDTGAQPLTEFLAAFLGTRQMLLVLDNFEQVLSAAPLVAELLSACPQVKALVTSRAVLHVRGEQELAVPPLAVPDLMYLPALTDLEQYGAIALFVQRARAARPTFALTERLAPLVAESCVRLDGLPLAIELAAARIKLLSPQALLERLGHRLGMLTGGAQDLPERQQTMRQAIRWSYDLLTAAEQHLFRLLAVFVGSWTLRDAEALAGATGQLGDGFLDTLTALVDTSLVQVIETPEQELHFSLLETMREYGLERLAEAGEMERVRRCHAEYYTSLAEQADTELFGPRHTMWIAQLALEQENLRAALEWAREQSAGEIGLRLVGALWRFWHMRGQLRAGRAWLEEWLAYSEREEAAISVALRARALHGAGALAIAQGDFVQALIWLEASVTLHQQIGDTKGLADSLNNLAIVAKTRGDYERAQSLYGESLVLRRQLGDLNDIASSLLNLGNLAFFQGDLTQAEVGFAESLSLFRQVGDQGGAGTALHNLGKTALHQGNTARAEALLQESLAVFEAQERPLGIALALSTLGQVARAQGVLDRAADLFAASLARSLAAGNRNNLADILEGIAGVACAQRPLLEAIRLFGVAAALRDTQGMRSSAVERLVVEQDIAHLRASLGEDAFAAAWETGRTMPLEQALEALKPSS